MSRKRRPRTDRRDVCSWAGRTRVRPAFFVRPRELRGARLAEFKVEDRVWIVPDARKKEGRDLIVPLLEQAIEVLESARSGSDGPPAIDTETSEASTAPFVGDQRVCDTLCS